MLLFYNSAKKVTLHFGRNSVISHFLTSASESGISFLRQFWGYIWGFGQVTLIGNKLC